MAIPFLAPDPDAKSLRAELLAKDVMDALGYCLQAGLFTSAEVHRGATLEDLAHGNGRVHGHAGSSSLRFYHHMEDPEWAVIFHTDMQADTERGRTLLLEAGIIPNDSPPELQKDELVMCPACNGSGGIDIGVGSVNCTICRNSGEVSAQAAEKFTKDNAFWGL